MKKLILTFFALFFITSLFAFDFGGSIKNDFYPNITNSYIKNNSDISFWFKTPLDFQGNTVLNFEIGFNSDMLLPDKAFTNIIDIRQLNLKMKIPLSQNWVSTFNMGANRVSDLSSIIFNEKAYSISFGFDFDNVHFKLLGGFAGFPLEKNFNASKENATNPQNNIIANATLKFDNFFGFAPLNLEVLDILTLAQQNKMYINVDLDKNFSKNLNLKVFSSFLLNSAAENKFGNFTKAQIVFTHKNTNFSGNVLYVSNDNEKLSAYESHSVFSVSQSKYIPLSNLIAIGSSISHNFTKKTLFITDANMFFSQNSETTKFDYQGLELKIDLEIRQSSDFFIAFGFVDFIDAEKVNKMGFSTRIKLDY